MILITILFFLNYYFIVKKNGQAIFIVNTCLCLVILASVFVSRLSPVESIFYKELNTESSVDNLIEITYENMDSIPYVDSVTNSDGYIIHFDSNSKIGIMSEEDNDTTDNIHGKLETKKINYELKSYLIKSILVIPTKKQFYIYNITSFEVYNNK